MTPPYILVVFAIASLLAALVVLNCRGLLSGRMLAVLTLVAAVTVLWAVNHPEANHG